MHSCESCGQEIPEQAVYCPFCGAPSREGEVDPSSVFTQPRRGVLCPGCGQRTLDEGAYCMWCGFGLDSLAEGTDPKGAPTGEAVTEIQGRVLDGTQKVHAAGDRGRQSPRALFLAVVIGLVVALVVVVLMLLAAQQRLEALSAEVAAARAEPRQDVGPAEARYREAADLAEQGRWSDASTMLRAALLSDPRHAAARAKLEEVEIRAQIAADARLARDELEARDFDGALQAVNKLPPVALVEDPELARLRTRVREEYRTHHQAEAAVAEKGGDFQAAEAHLMAVLAVEPDDAGARVKLDELRERLTRAKRQPPARASPAELAALAPELGAEELARKAHEAFQRGNHTLAIECLRRALKLKPDEPEYVRLLGNVYAVQGNRGEALRQYRRYLTLCPNCVYTQTVRSTIRGFEDLGAP